MENIRIVKIKRIDEGRLKFLVSVRCGGITIFDLKILKDEDGQTYIGLPNGLSGPTVYFTKPFRELVQMKVLSFLAGLDDLAIKEYEQEGLKFERGDGR